MTRATRRIPGSPALLVVALIVGLPAIGHAQLFPNRTVNRQRPACAQEPPFNAHVRRDYFGYYPTCWSRFPAGWACPCPNPELPNAAESFRKQPRDKPPGIDPGAEPETDDPAMPAAQPAEPNLPPMPSSRAPFDIDAKPGATDPVPPSPLRNPNGPTPTPGTGSGPAAVPIPAPTGLMEIPKLPSPTTTSSREPGSMTLPPPDETMLATASGNSVGGPVQANLGPLPMPNPGVASSAGEADTILSPAPARAPARKGVIGSLFNRRRR